MQEMNPMLVAGGGVTFVGWLLALICCIVRGWAKIDHAQVESDSGLWELCLTPTGGSETCTDIEDPDAWMKTVRAFVIIGIIVSAATLGMIVFLLVKTKMTGKSDSKIIHFAIIGAGIGAAVLMILANIIYGAKYEDNDIVYSADLDYAFGLHVVAAVFVAVGSILAFLSYKKE